MDIGETVIYAGEAYTVVGFTPVSVMPAEVQLRPKRGGESIWVERRLLGSEGPVPQRRVLRLPRKRDDAEQ